MTTPLAAHNSRSVLMSILNREQSEGVGARVRRSIGSYELRNFTPFLMLDHFKVSQGAGFPDHPHRGMTTLTYLLKGGFLHEDFCGNRGRLRPGDLQFMIAGKGIVHSEIPLIGKDGIMPEGLQLWIDLPHEHKYVEASYQDKKASEVPSANPSSDVTIKVICGESDGSESEGVVKSPVRPLGGCWFLDIQLAKAGASVFQRIPKEWSAFFYSLEGQVKIGDETVVEPFHTTVLSSDPEENGVLITAETPARVVLVAGEPLKQRIVQYGPMVLESQAEIQKAFADYRYGQNGFEGAPTWESRIKNLMDDPDLDVGQYEL